jgi:hypothetical protein
LAGALTRAASAINDALVARNAVGKLIAAVLVASIVSAGCVTTVPADASGILIAGLQRAAATVFDAGDAGVVA